MASRRACAPNISSDLADQEAKQLVGAMYGPLALHVDARVLRRSLDWKGVIQNIRNALRRYADGRGISEATRR